LFFAWVFETLAGVRLGRRILLIALTSGLVVFLLALAWPWEREPEYKGRRLNQWLEMCALVPLGPDARGARTAEAANEAVRQIGTNALPVLLRWTERSAPPWKDRLYSALQPLASRLGQGEALLFDVLQGERRAHWLSTYGFSILGEDARAATPELVRIMTAGSGGTNAIYALSIIGEGALPPLLSVVTNRGFQPTVRGYAMYAICGMAGFGTNDAWGVRVLANCLEDPDLAEAAADSLAKLHVGADLLLPPMAKCLQSTNVTVRINAMYGVWKFGREGGVLAPALLRLLSESEARAKQPAWGDQAEREAITNALLSIARELVDW
jgi:hypothetical protein